MHTTKNSVYCIASRKTKILFKTKAKADNFIRFNADEIYTQTGRKPIRSYYCTLCCGWHVTSSLSSDKDVLLDCRDNLTLENLLHKDQVKAELKSMSFLIRARLKLIDDAIACNDLNRATELTNQSSSDLDKMKEINPHSVIILRPERQLKRRIDVLSELKR